MPTMPAAQAEPAGYGRQFKGTNQHVTFGAAPGLGLSTFTVVVERKDSYPEYSGETIGQLCNRTGLPYR